jgi:hypothetical protein
MAHTKAGGIGLCDYTFLFNFYYWVLGIPAKFSYTWDKGIHFEEKYAWGQRWYEVAGLVLAQRSYEGNTVASHILCMSCYTNIWRGFSIKKHMEVFGLESPQTICLDHNSNQISTLNSGVSAG